MADTSARWDQRGTEHAAETLAWGLIDEQIELFRLGRPACDDSADGFAVLTGVDIGARCDPR